jgi:hypothetical protein
MTYIGSLGVTTRMANRLRDSQWKIPFICVFCVAFALFVYAEIQVECPYCHNSDANVKGQCVKRQRDGSCREDYYETHFNKSSCSWCRSAGYMTRISAWMD